MLMAKIRFLSVCTVLLVCSISTFAQFDPADPEEQVKASISRLNSNKKTLTLLLNNLLEFRGKVVDVTDKEFVLRFRNKERKTIRKTIAYSEVLALNGGGEKFSLIPAVTKRPHGNWHDIGKVFSGTKIVVALNDGRHVRGYSNSVNDTHLILLDRESKQRLDLPREGVTGFVAFTSSRGGAKKGAKWAAKELHQAPILGAFGVGIGAIVGALTKVEGQPVLIYSR